jgi:glycosyltransferase involved in cell wall biosynthesis
LEQVNIILSILVISHNQKEQLHRCIDSILHQNISFPHEIIISDDASTDGTWELIQEYEKKYPESIFGTQINSDDCNPANTSQRSGYNRCNSYNLARGKYIAHVDADDYFREGASVYQKQVELLETHPECSLCMQNVWFLRDGDSIEMGHAWFSKDKFYDEQVFSAREFILNNYFIINQAFVARKNNAVDPVKLYGKRYVDSVITYHHLQFGNVVYVDRCDYIYVKYPTAITESLIRNDQIVLWLLPVYIPLLIPKFTGLFYVSGLREILHIVNLARKGLKLSETTYKSVKDLNSFLYSVFGKKELNLFNRLRLNLLRLYLIFITNLKIRTSGSMKILYCLMINKRIPQKAEFRVR